VVRDVHRRAAASACYHFLMTNMASLSLDRLGDIRLAIGDVHLSPGMATHRVTIEVQVNGTWLEPESNAPTLLTGNPFRWLAALDPQVLAVRSYPVGEKLSFELGDDQLIALERARGRGDLTLSANLQASLMSPLLGAYPVADTQAQVRVRESRWLELLDQAGSEVGIVLRIPSPLTDPSLPPTAADTPESTGSLFQAAKRLRQARAELRDQQWETCVATCRQVLENLALLAPVLPASEIPGPTTKERTKDQRWAAIYHAVLSMAHAAHHDDKTTVDFTWTRSDAEAVLAATAGLLLRYTSSDR